MSFSILLSVTAEQMSVGSLSNYDGDGNRNDKKSIDLD